MIETVETESLESPSRSTLRVGAASHRGKVREENQDRISRFRVPLGDVFLVVDGMGGHEDGAHAAELVVRGFEEHLRGVPAEARPADVLREAALRTNAELYELSTGSESRKMGATVVLLLLQGRSARVAHAGDSRAYLVRDGSLLPWTRDHTLVQRMLDHDMLTEQEARDHPEASVVTRAFGPEPEVELEVSEPRELSPGDRVLLCSDGLCGYVDDAAIGRVLAAADDPQEATDRLIELALSAGGEDNVSVQVVRLERPVRQAPRRKRRRGEQAASRQPEQKRPPEERPGPGRPGRRRWGILFGAAALVVVLVVVLVWSFGGFRTSGSGSETGETTRPTGETS